MIDFEFRERKAAQAAAHLLRRHGGEMYYLLLIKLLYLADRQSLVERGLPITGDRLVSMDYGPVLSRVKDLLTDEPEPDADGIIWRQYVSEPEKYKVHGLSGDADVGELSEYELTVLDKIDSEYGSWDRWELCNWTHGLKEWQDPDGSSLPIDPRIILKDAGRSEEEIVEIADEAADSAYIHGTVSAR